MTAVDRITAIVAEHRGGFDLRSYHYRCDCGAKWPALPECFDDEIAEHARHVAERIAAADDLAVIELPKPDDQERAVWRLDPTAKPGYPDGSYVRTRYWPAGARIGAHGVSDMRVADAEQTAAALLAAVKAAEAVSDRGDN